MECSVLKTAPITSDGCELVMLVPDSEKLELLASNADDVEFMERWLMISEW